MSKRVFICTDNQFPEGNADSNYIRFLALALQYAGWKVFVIGVGKNREEERKKDLYSYRNINYYNINRYKDNWPFHLRPALTCGKQHIEILRNQKFSPNDKIIIYSSLYGLYYRLFDTLKVKKENVFMVNVEWMRPELYHLGRFNPSYILREYVINKYSKKVNRVFTISTKLAERFKNNGCNTFILPMMADYKSAIVSKRIGDKRKYIYPGAAFKKDKITAIVECLPKLDEKDLDRIEIHFTGLKEETLKKELGENGWLVDRYKEHIIFHGWLEYAELLELYSSIDYLLLFREKNLMTESNFPSKIPELMNYGIIPICSKVGDYTKLYLSDGKDCLMIDGADLDTCAQGIKRSLCIDADKLLQMRTDAKECVKNNFDFRKWGIKLEQILN